MIKAVLFDFDGVIADSKQLHDASWLYAIEKISNKKVKHLPHTEMAGKSPKIIASVLALKFSSKKDSEALLNVKNKYISENLDQVKMLPNADSAFRLLHELNIPFGIASNASKNFVQGCLNSWGFKEVVSFGYEDYERPKPNKEPYVKLANHLGIAKEDFKHVLVFEDSEIGLEAAENAGMKSVHIRSNCIVSISTLNKSLYSFDSVAEAVHLFH